MPQPDPLEQLLRYANPNPERIGCPGKDVLRALARKELPADHPAGNHLGQCSPCFREFRDIQREGVVRHRLILSTGLAACLLVVLAFLAKSSLFHRETPTSVAS